MFFYSNALNAEVNSKNTQATLRTAWFLPWVLAHTSIPLYSASAVRLTNPPIRDTISQDLKVQWLNKSTRPGHYSTLLEGV